MRRTGYHRIIACWLMLCMVVGSWVIPGGVKAEAGEGAWKVIGGNAADFSVDEKRPTDATFSKDVTAYYEQKIEIQDGTKIAVDVSVPVFGKSSELLDFAVALVDRPGSFNVSDKTANSLMAELVGLNNVTSVHGVASKKLTGGNRAFLANLTPLSASRNTKEVFHITYEKINVTESGVNYSWKITMQSLTNTQSYLVKASDIAQDMFKDGAYFAAGRREGATTHTVKVANLTVTQPQTQETLWKIILGNASDLSVDAENPENVVLKKNVTAYYDQKIEVQDGTKIEIDVSIPTFGAASDMLDYAFALVDRPGSFYTSDTAANSLMAEVVSQKNIASVYGIARTKLGANIKWLANLNPLSNSRNTAEVYHVTYEKVNMTEAGVNYSWRITMKSSAYEHSYLVKASDIAQDLFKDGAYFAAGYRDGAITHTVKVSNLMVTQPDDVAWKVIKGNASDFTIDSEHPADITFTKDVTAYYNQKIEVQDDTKIEVDVSIPVFGAASDMLNYAFALVDRPGSFYTSDTVANSLMAEVVSQAKMANVYGIARKKLGANVTWLANLNPLSLNRSSSVVYHITYEKINITEADVNYSWRITMQSSTHTQIYLVKATDIPHDMFKDGAYFAAGNRDGAITHTVKVANLTVGKYEPDVDDGSLWKLINGKPADFITNGPDSPDVTFQKTMAAYYNQKIEVEEGTTISFKVNYSQMKDGMHVNYGYSLVDRPGSFDISDMVANSLSVEINSMFLDGKTLPMSGVVVKKLTGAAERTWIGNMGASPLSQIRDTAEVYTVTYEKLPVTSEFSWKVTVASSTESQVYRVKATDIPHDMFKGGAYFAAGSRSSVCEHTVNIKELTIGKVQKQEETPWKVIAGDDRDLTVNANNPANAVFNKSVTAYYDEKIEIEEGTTISFKVNYSKMKEGVPLSYAFSLVDRAGSFDISDTEANSMSIELNSMLQSGNVLPVTGVVTKKLTGQSGRIWVGNIGVGPKRNTSEVFTVTLKKIDKTVNDVNYSWKVSVKSSAGTQSYQVKASDIPHDMFKNGAYFAAGTRTGVTPHTMRITDLTHKIDNSEEVTDIWTIIRGYSGIYGKGLSLSDGKVVMEGLGGLSYTKQSVNNAVAVEFALNDFDNNGGNFFTFALINKQGVYYRPDGSESQGIYVRIKQGKEGLDISTHIVRADGTEDVGIFTAIPGKNTKHTLAFYQEGGKWYVSIDGQQKMLFDGKVDLSDVSYFCAGANNTAGMSMTVSNVYIDEQVTSAMKAGESRYGFKVGGFKIIRGYGKENAATGKGIYLEDEKIAMEGFGGIAYVDRSVKSAAAVEFEMNTYDSTKSPFFTFALINKENVYYRPDGSESQGIFVRVNPWVNGQGFGVNVYNLSANGNEHLGTLNISMAPRNRKQTLAFYKEDEKWYVSINGQWRMRLDLEVDLAEVNYLVCGANPTNDLKMSVHKVYIRIVPI